MRRFDMRLPAIVRLEGASEVHTETQNVSARGVFFYLDRPVSAGTKLEVTLTFPPPSPHRRRPRPLHRPGDSRRESSALGPHRNSRHDRGLRIPPLQRQPRFPRRPANRMESNQLSLSRGLGFVSGHSFGYLSGCKGSHQGMALAMSATQYPTGFSPCGPRPSAAGAAC